MQITTQDELNLVIKNKFSQLSKRLQQVAHYILEHPNEIAVGTAAKIAKAADVPPSTLIRFARALDFSGFSDIQKLFKSRLLQESPSYSSRIKSIVDDNVFQQENPYLHLLNQITESNSQSLKNLDSNLSEQALSKAIAILSASEIIHIQGARRSFPVACYLTYLLSNIQLRANLFNNLGNMHKEQEQLMTAKDSLIAISFLPYAEETQDLIEKAKSKNLPTVLITDDSLHPLSDIVDVCLTVKEADIHSFRSLSATMCLVQTLAICIGHHLDTNNHA
jgi:DNA-binding MurR/RpiR family transcriptional regulator